MPLTEDWLVDFAGFFDLGAGQPQMARAIGPHLARPFGLHEGVGVEGAPDALVLRDLIACTRGDLRSIRSLTALAREHLPGVLDGWFVEDEGAWTEEIRAWLKDAGLDAETAERLSKDPPLTLFLMIEAEKDSDGERLGALGSFIMAETITAALPLREGAEIDAERARVFGKSEPACMADVIRVVQDHYNFAEGARLFSAPGSAVPPKTASATGGKAMLDQNTAGREPELIEVADHIEMGRLVIEWATDKNTRPKTLDELKAQLDGIARVPDRIKSFEFCQGTKEKLVLRLPVKEMMERAVNEMSDPERNGNYPMPQFYSDFYRPGFSPVMSPLETLMARVGDYTIAQCK
jgi:hypothetical protein